MRKEIKNEAKIKLYAKDILSGLKEIHSKGVIHADIKPANLLLLRPNPEDKAKGEKAHVKICDFGISLVLTPELFEGKKCAFMKVRSGSGGYIAPEVKGENIVVTTSIDMWAFGIVLYEMCVAYEPIQVRGYQYGSGPLPFRPRDWRRFKEHGNQLQDLISKCL